jgi:hypothetical protein
LRWLGIDDRVIGIPIAIAVCISVVARAALVIIAVTVVIYAITDLGGVGIDIRICIVAVPSIHYVARWWGSIYNRVPWVAVGVAVSIAVIDDASLVNISVTVIIRPVADFSSARIDAAICIVAVPAVLRRITFMFICGGVVGVPIGIIVLVPIPKRAVLIDVVVAVVVLAIAELGGAGVNGGIRIITVPAAGDITIGRAGICHRVVVISKAVMISVSIIGGAALINGSIAVVIDVVAYFSFPWIDMGIIVVTVIIGWIAIEVIVQMESVSDLFDKKVGVFPCPDDNALDGSNAVQIGDF